MDESRRTPLAISGLGFQIARSHVAVRWADALLCLENADKIIRKIAESVSGGALTPPQHLSRAIDGDGGQQRRDSGPHFAEALVRG